MPTRLSPLNRTFGFEAEWQTNAETLISTLNDVGAAECDHLHYYHCGCEYCEPWGDYAFYGQNDSSCSGEVISTVHSFSPTAADHYGSGGATNATAVGLFATLADAAYDAGAQPGQNAGFHVHVGTGDKAPEDKADVILAMARWERVLRGIASGREQEVRRYNDGMAGQIGYAAQEVLNNAGLRGTDDLDAIDRVLTLNGVTSPERDRLARRVSSGRLDISRASFVNTRTGHNTWEFRLWNSTRSPWRMEMYVRTSIALCDPAVTEWMRTATKGVPSLRPRGYRAEAVVQRGIDRFACALHDLGHEEAAVLIDRQRDYREKQGWTALRPNPDAEI